MTKTFTVNLVAPHLIITKKVVATKEVNTQEKAEDAFEKEMLDALISAVEGVEATVGGGFRVADERGNIKDPGLHDPVSTNGEQAARLCCVQEAVKLMYGHTNSVSILLDTALAMEKFIVTGKKA